MYGVLALLLAIAIGFAAYFLAPQKEAQSVYQPSQEELYQMALNRIDSDNVDSLQSGMELMDSLSNMNYIPAIYQMAFTYGWYSDKTSVKRKKMLGIDMDQSYLPTSDRYSNKAVALFTRIMEMNDSAYADINANAIYRLACYYVMPNNIYKSNYEKGKMFLIRSREWAVLAGDQNLIDKIEKGLASFQNE